MPRAFRIGTLILGIGLMLIGCTDPATLPNEIQAVNDLGNTNMPAAEERGRRSVGTIVMSGVTRPLPTPSPRPTPIATPTPAPTPSPSPSGPIALR